MPCEEQYSTKYTSRNSPPYPAQECRGMLMEGNDGNLYLSKTNKNDVASWKIQKNTAPNQMSNMNNFMKNTLPRYKNAHPGVNHQKAFNDVKSMYSRSPSPSPSPSPKYIRTPITYKGRASPKAKPQATKTKAKPKPSHRKSVSMDDLLDHAALTGCADGKIRNPDTNRCIAIGGKIFNNLAATHGMKVFFQ